MLQELFRCTRAFLSAVIENALVPLSIPNPLRPFGVNIGFGGDEMTELGGK